MKIKELKISNILSFKHHENIEDATKITFDNNLNIFIGENGSGKSTALEVINFIFKRVLFTQFNVNQDLYSKRDKLNFTDKKQIITQTNHATYSSFRLEPNWNTENESQKIQMTIELDAIDIANVDNLVNNAVKIQSLISSYTNYTVPLSNTEQNTYIIDIVLNKIQSDFTTRISPNSSDPGYLYLVNYNYYKELISLYNLENPQNQIDALYESFTLIGGYRNYHSFNPFVSLQSASAVQQMQDIQTQEYSRSLNANDQSEPVIFNIVRLRIAGKHHQIYGNTLLDHAAEVEANKEPFLFKINQKLKLVNLEVKIQFTSKQNWSYSFQFFDVKRQKPLSDINSLSAGQKAIIHLVFEAYGRGDLKGGLVIIDEPEIHLHYQFQNEYLKVIQDINRDQGCQYVLVTHSESLINSATIHKVKRFALDNENYTDIKNPELTDSQSLLVKILDNTRSTYAFFAKKVVLLEGETDRYFFKSMIQAYKSETDQQIAFLDIGGKPKYLEWKNFFEAFGLTVYYICDLDNAFELIYGEKAYSLKTAESISRFKSSHTNLSTDIEQKYLENIFILKNGELEDYLEIPKGKEVLNKIIKFCNSQLANFLLDNGNKNSKELRSIIDRIN